MAPIDPPPPSWWGELLSLPFPRLCPLPTIALAHADLHALLILLQLFSMFSIG
jgi:hypothetical protein